MKDKPLEIDLMFQVGIDLLCPQCGEIVPACTQHNCTQKTAPKATRALCSVCLGNGVVKIHGGVAICDRCAGDCWEPEPKPEEDHIERVRRMAK